MNTMTQNPSITQPTHQTAKRLISTHDLDRNDWLAVRQQGIGSSDAAAACGIHPYLSMLELWMIKTGRVSHEQTDDSGYAPLYWGLQLEPVIARYYSDKTGNKVRRVNAVLQHPDHEFMLANLDYDVVKSDEVQLLECKSTGQYGTKHWQRGVPLYVVCQVQHQLAVTGKQAAHVCVLLAGHEAKIYKVERNEQLITKIIAAEQQFWEYVRTDTPPPTDASASSAKALQQLYPSHTPQSIKDCRDDSDANGLFAQYLLVQRRVDYHSKHRDEIKHLLQAQMQDAEKAIFSTGSITWKRSKDSTSLDSKAVLAKHPELLTQFPKTRKGSRRFLVHPD